MAKRYLEDENISLKLIRPQDYFQFGKTIFKTLEKDSAGYHQIDERGHQIMLNYRSSSSIAAKFTLTEVLKSQINPDLVKNRIVLVGTIAPSFNDNIWLTPYSGGKWPIERMTGIEIEAHKVSQILSAVLDHRPLIWWWSKQAETVWIWCWSLVGGVIGWSLRSRSVRLSASRSHQIIAGTVAVLILYSICFLFLLQGGWIPLVPSALALTIAGLSLTIYYNGLLNGK